RRWDSSITQMISASSTNSEVTWFFAQGSVPADVTHMGAHISASSIAAVGLRSRLPVQTIRTFFIPGSRSAAGPALFKFAQPLILVFGLNCNAIVETLEFARQARQRLVSLLQTGVKMFDQRFR